MEIKEYLLPSETVKPIIYAYNAVDGTGKPHNEGYIKIGFTSRHDFPTGQLLATLKGRSLQLAPEVQT